MDRITKLDSLRKKLRRKKLDALLICQPENRRYLSGYSAGVHGIGESSGALLIPWKGDPYLLTDFRFVEQAERQANGYIVRQYPKGLVHYLKNLLPQLKITKLGFESSYTLHSTAQKLFELGKRLGIEMIPTSGIVEEMRLIKSEEEINTIRKSVQLNEEVFTKVFLSILPGKNEIEIALEIAAQMRLAGAERESFETIVASGPNGSLPHAVPSLAKLETGTSVVVDMGLILDGYCSDMTRSFCLGQADNEYLKIHRIVRKAQLAGIAAVRNGVPANVVDKAARKVIADGGYGKFFGHALGHGVGLAVHEEPRVSKKSRKKLRSGMVITIEPGIYIPGWGGIRLENMVVVRDDGCENLNSDTTWLDI